MNRFLSRLSARTFALALALALVTVTGASAGIGLEIVQQLAARGHDIVGVPSSDKDE